jgi:hypothetical protein
MTPTHPDRCGAPDRSDRPDRPDRSDRGGGAVRAECRNDLVTERVPARWQVDRDLDAVAAYLDRWILAAEPDHYPAATAIPLLGTPEWMAADDRTRDASVALYVLACLAEREPVVIAARLAAEIAAGRLAHLVAMRQAAHAISAALFPRPARRGGRR